MSTRPVRLTQLLLLLTLSLLVVGCGDHSSSSAGPVHAATTKPSPSPLTRLLRVAAVRSTEWHLPYPVARTAVIDQGRGSVILAGGLLAGDLSTSRVLRLNVRSGREHALPPLAVPVHDTAGGLVAHVPSVVGGGNSAEQSGVQSLVHSRWHMTGSLPTPRSDLGIEEWRGRAYVIGGYDGGSEPRQILRLSPPAPPRLAGNLLHGVRYAAMARIGSQVFVFGGEVDGRELDTVQQVDLATGHTRPGGRLPLALGHAMAATVGDRILLMGGRSAPSRQTHAMWWFYPATRRFHVAGHLPVALSDAAVASYRRRVWLLGGESPAVTDRVVEVTFR